MSYQLPWYANEKASLTAQQHHWRTPEGALVIDVKTHAPKEGWQMLSVYGIKRGVYGKAKETRYVMYRTVRPFAFDPQEKHALTENVLNLIRVTNGCDVFVRPKPKKGETK